MSVSNRSNRVDFTFVIYNTRWHREGNGRYWYVCDINGENGEIEIRNQIVEYEPGT